MYVILLTFLSCWLVDNRFSDFKTVSTLALKKNLCWGIIVDLYLEKMYFVQIEKQKQEKKEEILRLGNQNS